MNEESNSKLAEKLLTAYGRHTEKGGGTVGIKKVFEKVLQENEDEKPFTVRNLIEILAKQNWDAPVFVVKENDPILERPKFNITGLSVFSGTKFVELLIEEGE